MYFGDNSLSWCDLFIFLEITHQVDMIFYEYEYIEFIHDINM